MALQRRFKKPVAPVAIPFVGPRMMSPEKAAEYIAVSKDVIYDMLKAKKILYVRNGRHYLIDRLDLDKWIDANKEGVAA